MVQVRFGANTQDLQAGVSRAQTALSSLLSPVEAVGSAFARMGDSVAKGAEAFDASAWRGVEDIGKVLAGLTTGAGVGLKFFSDVSNSIPLANKLTEFLTGTNHQMVLLAQNARQVGLSLKEYQRFEYAAEQGGVGRGDFAGNMQKAFDKYKGLLDDSDEKLKSFLTTNHIAWKSASGDVFSFGSYLLAVSNLIRNAGSGMNAFADKMKVGDVTGMARQMVEAWSIGAKGLQGLGDEGEKVGDVLGDELVHRAEEFDKQWSKSSAQWGAVMKEAIVSVTPYMNQLVAGLGAGLRELIEWWSKSSGAFQLPEIIVHPGDGPGGMPDLVSWINKKATDLGFDPDPLGLQAWVNSHVPRLPSTVGPALARDADWFNKKATDLGFDPDIFRTLTTTADRINKTAANWGYSEHPLADTYSYWASNPTVGPWLTSGTDKVGSWLTSGKDKAASWLPDVLTGATPTTTASSAPGGAAAPMGFMSSAGASTTPTSGGNSSEYTVGWGGAPFTPGSGWPAGGTGAIDFGEMGKAGDAFATAAGNWYERIKDIYTLPGDVLSGQYGNQGTLPIGQGSNEYYDRAARLGASVFDTVPFGGAAHFMGASGSGLSPFDMAPGANADDQIRKWEQVLASTRMSDSGLSSLEPTLLNKLWNRWHEAVEAESAKEMGGSSRWNPPLDTHGWSAPPGATGWDAMRPSENLEDNRDYYDRILDWLHGKAIGDPAAGTISVPNAGYTPGARPGWPGFGAGDMASMPWQALDPSYRRFFSKVMLGQGGPIMGAENDYTWAPPYFPTGYHPGGFNFDAGSGGLHAADVPTAVAAAPAHAPRPPDWMASATATFATPLTHLTNALSGTATAIPDTSPRGPETKFADDKDKDAVRDAIARARGEISAADESYRDQVEKQNSLVTMTKVTEDERRDAVIKAINARMAAQLAGEDALAKAERAAHDTTKADVTRIENEKTKIIQEAIRARERATDEALKRDAQEWASVLKPFESAFNSQLRALLSRTETLHQAMRKMLSDLAMQGIEKVESFGMEKAATGLAGALGGPQTFLGSLFGGAQGASTAANTSALTVLTAAITANTAALGGSAAVSATGSAASAAGSAGGLFSGFKALLGLFGIPLGLEVGAWNIPKPMVASLHPGESVVPRTFASGLRAAMSGNGSIGGGDTHVHNHNWSAVDGPSVQRWLSSGGARQLANATARERDMTPSMAW
jgi:hypothetical protein